MKLKKKYMPIALILLLFSPAFAYTTNNGTCEDFVYQDYQFDFLNIATVNNEFQFQNATIDTFEYSVSDEGYRNTNR